MSKRYAILYETGDFNVHPDGHDEITARKWLRYDETGDEDDKLVEVEIKVIRIIHDKNPRFQIATEHSATCPTCGTEVFMESNP